MGVKAPRKKNELVVGKDSSASTKSKNKLKKMAKKREEEKEKKQDDAVVEISADNVLNLDGASSQPAVKKTAGRQALASGADDDDDTHSEIEAQEKALDLKGKGRAKGPKAFEQRDLVALAFAGDNVVHVCFSLFNLHPLFQHSVTGIRRGKETRNRSRCPERSGYYDSRLGS